MPRQSLIERLDRLPAAIAEVELTLLAAEEARQEAQALLQVQEDRLLLYGEQINGRNAEVRAVQLRAETAEEQVIVEEAGRRLARLRVAWHERQAEHASLRAIARLLATEPD
jgi:hypothetical protein